jgi:RimJ/RimL family protein N-acetyltransferase
MSTIELERRPAAAAGTASQPQAAAAPTPGQALLRALKDTTRADRAPALVLPVVGDGSVRALLRPIATLPGQTDPTDVRLLSEWRNRHVTRFLTEFEAHDARTRQWLEGPIHAHGGKILFMLDTPDGVRLGHLGLGFIDWRRGYGEADAIVSGGASPPGLMQLALRTLLAWAHGQLGLSELAVRVRSDNPACEFYRKVGFVEFQRVPLGVRIEPGLTEWFEDPALPAGREPSLVHMRYQAPAALPD